MSFLSYSKQRIRFNYYSLQKVVRKVFLYIILTLIAIFFIGPFIWLLSTSLKETGLYNFPPEIIPRTFTLGNYIYVLNKLDFYRYILNSIFITFFGVLLNLIFSSMAAYPLARIDFPGKKIIFATIISTMMLPNSAGLIINFLTMRYLGLVNSRIAVFLPSSVTVFGIFLLRQNYLTIPKDLEDAARIDGCSEFRIWWNIMLPLIKPGLTTLVIFDFMAHWNSFLWPLIILQDSEKYPLAAGLQYLQGTFTYNFKYIAAGTIISILPIILIYVLLQKYFIKGVAGAIKG